MIIKSIIILMIIKAFIILMMLEVTIIFNTNNQSTGSQRSGEAGSSCINKRGWPPAPLVRAQHHQHHGYQHHHQPNQDHGHDHEYHQHCHIPDICHFFYTGKIFGE